MQLIRQITLETAEVLQAHVPTHSRLAIERALATAACRVYGKEGRDWRMVQDTTVIGRHVRALGPWDGQTIEIR